MHDGPTLRITLPPRFDLARAVCSYGYFILAPNRWDPLTRVFQRPLTLVSRGVSPRTRSRRADSHVVTVTLWQSGKTLNVACNRKIDAQERIEVKRQVARILRLDEPPEVFRDFQRLYPRAKKANFGRLFRSPTLFEDIVKTMTGCNVTWPNTMRMNVLLCEQIGQANAFPSPEELARVRPATLKARCKVGYRAQRIVRLAKDFAEGSINPAWFEDPARTTDELYEALLNIHGIGPYAAHNILQLLGHYDHVAIDSETYRHFRQNHPEVVGQLEGKARDEAIRNFYNKVSPYQFLAYWHDLWVGYEKKAGDARWWEAHVHGPTFTANRMRNEP
ncbi:MAG: hypothetical protein GC164_05910 [Phycisphaera sp.]|nr:hypothetical protein [Phycisphaera sp.]